MAFRVAAGNKAASTSVAVAKPAGIIAGDLLIAFCAAYRSTSATAGTPTIANTGAGGSAWSSVTTQTTATRYKCSYAWKVAATDGDGSVTDYTWSSASSTQMVGGVIVLSGRQEAAPTPISNTAYTTSDTNIRAATLTAAANDDLVWAGYNYLLAVQAVTKPSGWTEGTQQTAAAAIAMDMAYKEAVGAGATGSVDGTVAANATVKHAFMFAVPKQAAPTVTAISPELGTIAGGTAVTITGTNFRNASGVTFGGEAATSVVVVSNTSITCTTPDVAAYGATDVVVSTPGGNSAAYHFHYASRANYCLNPVFGLDTSADGVADNWSEDDYAFGYGNGLHSITNNVQRFYGPGGATAAGWCDFWMGDTPVGSFAPGDNVTFSIEIKKGASHNFANNLYIRALQADGSTETGTANVADIDHTFSSAEFTRYRVTYANMPALTSRVDAYVNGYNGLTDIYDLYFQNAMVEKLTDQGQLLNAGFETDGNADGFSDSWSVANSDVAGTPTYSRPAGVVGSYSQRIQYTGTAGDDGTHGILLEQDTSAASFVPGESGVIKVRLKGALSGCKAQLWLLPMDSSNNVLSYDYYLDNPTITSSWTQFDISARVMAIAPASTDHVRVQIAVVDIGNGDTVDLYVDDVQLLKTGAFFCGDTSGAWWSGTADASVSCFGSTPPAGGADAIMTLRKGMW